MNKWEVRVKKSAVKKIQKLPKEIKARLVVFIKKLEIYGPKFDKWPKNEAYKYKNYSVLKGKNFSFHCHLKKGKPTYVICWSMKSNFLLVEVYYVGTHEKAPALSRSVEGGGIAIRLNHRLNQPSKSSIAAFSSSGLNPRGPCSPAQAILPSLPTRYSRSGCEA